MRGVLVAVGVAICAPGCGRYNFDAVGDGGGGGDAPDAGSATCTPTPATGTVLHVDATAGSDPLNRKPGR